MIQQRTLCIIWCTRVKTANVAISQYMIGIPSPLVIAADLRRLAPQLLRTFFFRLRLVEGLEALPVLDDADGTLDCVEQGLLHAGAVLRARCNSR
jgi:hypothetical protein